MEIDGGSGIHQGVRHSWSKEYPSGTRCTSYLQAVLLLVMLTTQFHWAASTRNETKTIFEAGPRPWNKTLYKVERNCLDFHLSNYPSFFYFWPEDDPRFDHCCSRYVQIDIGLENTPPTQLMADNFTHGPYGPQLNYVLYYDLGLIDQCFPFWKCRRLYVKLYRTFGFHVPCERTDVQRLYDHRFWNGSVLKHGLLESAIPFILSLEIFFVLFASYYLWRQRAFRSRQILRDVCEAWFEAMHKTVLMVWVHLCLLAIIGNGLIEAVGHQDVYSSQSKSFYNYAGLYVWLSVLIWVSSLLQQISYLIAVIEDCDFGDSAPGVLPQSNSICRRSSVLKELEEKIGLNADWKWQPIAAQAAILFCLWGFLTYIDDAKNMIMSAGLFGVVVQTAAPWSGLFAMKIIFNALPFLLKRIYCSLRPSIVGMRRCWPTIGRLRRKQGLSIRQHADPEAPDVPLAGLGLRRSDTLVLRNTR